MVAFTAGFETYGSVKSVGGTPIVTKFLMVQILPIYPLRSYYFAGISSSTSPLVSAVTGVDSFEIHGVPLARLDVASVVMSYVRGVFGGLAVLGFMAIVPLVMLVTGERLDAFATIVLYVLVGCFVVGVVGGFSSYLIPTLSRRERSIRTACGELLGICIDPARVEFANAKQYLECALSKIADESSGSTSHNSSHRIAQLIETRARIALGEDRPMLERRTDELLGSWEYARRMRPC